jgi:hypothetical protein
MHVAFAPHRRKERYMYGKIAPQPLFRRPPFVLGYIYTSLAVSWLEG